MDNPINLRTLGWPLIGPKGLLGINLRASERPESPESDLPSVWWRVNEGEATEELAGSRT